MTPLKSTSRLVIQSEDVIAMSTSPARRIMFFIMFAVLTIAMITGFDPAKDLAGGRLLGTLGYGLVLLILLGVVGWSKSTRFDRSKGNIETISRIFGFTVRHEVVAELSAIKAVVLQKVQLLKGRDIPLRKSGTISGLFEPRTQMFRLFLEAPEERIKIDESSYSEEVEKAAALLSEFLGVVRNSKNFSNPMFYRSLQKAFILMVLFPGLGFAEGPVGPVHIVGIQLRIGREMYNSVDAFAEVIDAKLKSVFDVEDQDLRRPDLVVFPEYTSVFLSLIPYQDQIAASASVMEALDKITLADPSVGSVEGLFERTSPWVESTMDAVWGEAARRFRTTIVAGTRFVDRKDGLKNSLLIYGPDGKRVFEQDKVYLTDFEIDIIGLSPGSLYAARLFELHGRSIAFTVCRDTFFAAWDRRLGGADYWIDIKANGTEFTQEESERFLRALPKRIEGSETDYGMTVCLTGNFLDLYWEGTSFTVEEDTTGVWTKQVAGTATGDATIHDAVR